jgi:hypothetical protein
LAFLRKKETDMPFALVTIRDALNSMFAQFVMQRTVSFLQIAQGAKPY